MLPTFSNPTTFLMVYRLLQMQDVLYPPSHCDRANRVTNAMQQPSLSKVIKIRNPNCSRRFASTLPHSVMFLLATSEKIRAFHWRSTYPMKRRSIDTGDDCLFNLSRQYPDRFLSSCRHSRSSPSLLTTAPFSCRRIAGIQAAARVAITTTAAQASNSRGIPN